MTSRFIINKFLDYARLLSFAVAIFFYYFQVPFMEQSWLITTGMALYLFLYVHNIAYLLKEKIEIFIGYILLLILCFVNAAYSNYIGTDITNITRFFLIVTIIPLIPILIRDDNDRIYKIFSIFSLCKAIMIIVIAYIVVSTGTFSEMRLWAQANKYGDVYSLYNSVPRVQLNGNALLVLAFMISFLKNKRLTIYSIVLLVSILLAGNFAFILALAVFFLWQYCDSINLRRFTLKQIFVTIMLGVCLIGFAQYTAMEAENKNGGADSSNGRRIQQIEILADTNYLIGNGLGSVVKEASKIGASTENQYYEIQTMYIFYQVGFIVLFLYYVVLFSMAKSRYNHNGNIIFFIYLFYSFFNPYCFDSTQMFAMILIASKFPNKCNNLRCIVGGQ